MGLAVLTLFASVQMLMCFTILGADFAGGSTEILRKSIPLPLQRWAGMLFLLSSGLRNQIFLGWWVTTVFGVGIMFMANPHVAAVAAVLFTLMAADCTILAAFIVLASVRMHAMILWTIVFVGLVLCLAPIALSESLSGAIPIASWVASGIVAASVHDAPAVSTSIALLFAVPLGLLMLGRKLA